MNEKPEAKAAFDLWTKHRDEVFARLEALGTTPEGRQSYWESYMGAVLGAMVGDLGIEVAKRVPQKMVVAIEFIEQTTKEIEKMFPGAFEKKP
jgi:hypothetical protein